MAFGCLEENMTADRFLCFSVLFLFLGILAWNDWRYRKIPNRILVFLLAARGVWIWKEWVLCPETGKGLLLFGGKGFLLGGGTFLMCRVFSGGGIGAGDVKLAAVLGWWLGSRRFLKAVFLAALPALGYCVVLLFIYKKGRKHQIPLAPFLWFGTVMAMVWKI